MGKKRQKDKSPVEDNDVDLTAPVCCHIRKGIDRNILKRLPRDLYLNTCQDCKDEDYTTEVQLGDREDRETPTIWMCLKCGNRGCGRNSENQHAIKHYEKPRSDQHCLVVNLEIWCVWCYICDDEIKYSRTGNLAQLVTCVKKQVSSKPCKTLPQRKVELGDSMMKETQEIKQPGTGMEKNQEDEENIFKQKKNVKKDSGMKGQSQGVAKDGSVGSVKGLSNLGNTCFFNAVVQNLSQTRLLRQILNKDPILVQLEQPGSLTLAMCEFLHEIQLSRKQVVTPRELFTQVCKKAGRFKGCQQQDSHELLRYMLDGMRAEEIKRVSSGILASLKKAGDVESSKTLITDYERNGFPNNAIDQVFGGEMTSTIMCQQCKTVSFVTEMFLDLSLPVSDEAYKTHSKNPPKSSEGSQEGRDSSMRLANGIDMSTDAGSKYQQRKAKKQAKKQAKNPRRQQDFEGKLKPNSLTDQETAVSTQSNNADNESVEIVKSGTLTDEPKSKDQPAKTDLQGKDLEYKLEEEEDSVVDYETSPTSVVSNHNTALSEDQNTGKQESLLDDQLAQVKQGGEDVDPSKSVKGEEQLAKYLENMSLNNSEDGEVDMESATAKQFTVVNHDPDLAFQTLASRMALKKQDCSVQSCLFQFTEVEHLTENNSLLCIACTRTTRQLSNKISEGSKNKVYTDALKQILISSPPPVLTLHLKRFQQVGYSVCKLNRHVNFPQILDLAPFCSVNCKGVTEGDTQVLYSLYGIVEHSGTMRSGHYTAYVKTQLNCSLDPHNGVADQGEAGTCRGSWFHVSDSSVKHVMESKVQSSQAYILFYERLL
ncbi:ubiquitin carboxyl-terminal hydrolase 16 isoform X2 [Hypomesus transpacificus]|uniref:ubiquitin carboxyl-terminal hydrolase 16 isoform X2 n=1 Tax=Hypomesus transpacificus TaxID=137520 RepID=UPI001F087AD9|nr:ubiquitin carboxyl-terminal hydrolase 16 isoform X2 [Hypomesus transpacificus]